MFKNINILKCHEHNMRNPNLECIQIRTNIFGIGIGIGSLIREIDVKISEMLENNNIFAQLKLMPTF